MVSIVQTPVREAGDHKNSQLSGAPERGLLPDGYERPITGPGVHWNADAEWRGFRNHAALELLPAIAGHHFETWRQADPDGCAAVAVALANALTNQLRTAP